MSILTISLPEDAAAWLKENASRTGRTPDEIVLEQIERARLQPEEKPWMKYVGCIEGAPDLSMREGFEPR